MPRPSEAASGKRDYRHRGVVDNKVCSVSDTIGAMRFVIRKVERQ